MKPERKLTIIPTVVVLFLALALCGNAAAVQQSKILVLPFNINSDKDLSFLQRGIKNMLHSRLSMEGKGLLIDPRKSGASLPASLDTETALELGRKLSADYVVLGNLTVFGESVSTDCSFLDVKKGEAKVSFGDFGESHGDALAHINRFATTVRERVFGYAPRRGASPRPSMPAQGYMPAGAMPFNSFNANIWKSGKIDSKIRGISVGDVDGDGANETVLLSDTGLSLHRLDQGRFLKIAEEKTEVFHKVLGIDIADINGNGKAEVFVTAIREKSRRLQSYVLEWNGTGFNSIAQNEKWFFRVIKTKEGEKILLGQGQQAERDSDIFKRGIHELKWENGAYVTDRRLILPPKAVIYGFAVGDVLNNGQENYLMLLPNGKIQVLDRNGNDLWTSSDRYGGNITYMEYPSEREPSLHVTGEREMENYYLQHRIHIADMDRDGKNEVVVVNNHNLLSRAFSKIRTFDNGYITALMWNTIGLQEKWKIQKVTGSITDYTVDDLDNDGQEELVFSVMEKGGHLTVGKKSYVASWRSPNQ